MDTPQTWTRNNIRISTDKSHLSLASINAAFDSEAIYWARSIPIDALQQIVNNSLCFGVYEDLQNSECTRQIGFGRLVTDYVTFAYLTDVYILPEYNGRGIGGWLVDCVQETLEAMPYLRWAMLRTSGDCAKNMYIKRLGMEVLLSGEEVEGAIMMGKRGKENMI
ncbi:hypothetical protein N7454_005360 [Penicillium verhagenii]|nr:hypothetical protein N7454_005360 [Penicillium verhagenii]